MLLHLTARSLDWPLTKPGAAELAWSRLRRAWPRALACVLMGNHLHLVVEGSPDLEQRRLRQVVGQWSGWRSAPMASAEPVEPKRLARVLRYVALNPVRAKLCEDPLEWAWTTHRDVVGAVAQPWVGADRVREALGWSEGGFVGRFHRYLSADAGAGTALPQPAPGVEMPGLPLEDVARAASACHRAPLARLRVRGPVRSTFFHLAHAQGWRSSAVVAARAGVHPSTVRRAWSAPVPNSAAALCLGDARLCRPVLPSAPTHADRAFG